MSEPPHSSPHPSSFSSSPSLRHTRHQSRQYLHISQQINSVEHNPCRELSNIHCGPPSHSFFSHPPTHSAVCSTQKHASHSYFIDSCPSLFPRLPQLASSLLPKSLRPSVCHIAQASQRRTTCVFCTCRGSNWILHSSFMYKSAALSGIWRGEDAAPVKWFLSYIFMGRLYPFVIQYHRLNVMLLCSFFSHTINQANTTKHFITLGD